ncbi:MAG: terminase TerL endonuclease subunit [Peptococcia bacterium]
MIDNRRANEPIEFIQLLKHTGDFYGRPFVLQDWQKEVLRNVYGEVTESGYRRYRYAYLEIPKKNGKTETVAGLALYHLVCDPPGGQIYCCAAEREQASLVYKAAKQMIEQDPELEALLRVVDSKKEIYNRETGTFLKVLSAEAYSKHGLNPTVVIFDELHAQPNRDLWDVMTFGAGAARKEPLWWVITTAGDDPDRKSIGWEIHERAQRIQDGILDDPTWCVKIYSAPEDADIFDEATWRMANPSLGVSISLETVRQEAAAAKESQASEKLFRWLRLNQWVALKRTSWLPLTLWDDTEGNWKLSEMRGKRCYVGLDLSSTTDLTAIALLFPPQAGVPEWRCSFRAFVPDESMKERIRRDHVPYDEWIRSGHLTATEGDAVDYELVQRTIEQIADEYRLAYLCADKWNSQMMTQALAKKKGIKTVEVGQDIAGMSPAMKELARLMYKRELTHDFNPLARWCFGNVVVYMDGNENIKPMKNKSFERIDLIVALINAMAVAMRMEKKRSAYVEHGIRVV